MNRLPFVYLMSPPFSGSTLFSFLANAHPQIATVGEMTGLNSTEDPERYLCSCKQPILHCDFWKQVSADMIKRGFSFTPAQFDTLLRIGQYPITQRMLNSSLKSNLLEDIRDQAIRLLPEHHRRRRYLIERNKSLASAVLTVSGCRVFFDASKNAGLVRHLHRDDDVDLRVVHMVRDVRGASRSRRKNLQGVSWEHAVKLWVRANRRIELQLKRLPEDRVIRIRYEEMCANPNGTMNRFFEFCQLPQHEIDADFQSSEHHIVGNRMRLKDVGRIRLDEAWRRSVTLEEQDYANRIAGTMHNEYGYPPMCESDLESV